MMEDDKSLGEVENCVKLDNKAVLKQDIYIEEIETRLICTKTPESLARCRTMFLFPVFCKIGALERNAYWFHVKLIFIVIFGQSFKLDVRG